MTEPIGVALAAALLGAVWRRWLGGEHNSRVMKLSVGFVLFLGVATYSTQHWLSGLIVALILLPGFGDGVLFNPQKPLIYRYGAVTLTIALALVYMGHWAYWYAPVGCLVYFAYAIPKYIADRWWKDGCWSCCGEVFCGAIIVGPIPLLRLF